MKFSLGFSPCPNDTFIFYAMTHGKVDTEGIDFELIMEDVEALNQLAFAKSTAITKLSYHAFAHLTDSYQLLDAGSALGNNCGPLLVSKKNVGKEQVNDLRIAIPGKFTTANFLLNLAFPQATNKQEMLFSDIENAVLREEVDAGLIIHENRFTYQEKGLQKIMDLGEYWESTTQLPIPLGGIVVRRDLPQEIKEKINRVLRRSVAFAFANKEATKPFVRQFAQEMDEKVMFQHISLYVNDYTLSLGEKGREAVRKLFGIAEEKGVIPSIHPDIFVDEPLGRTRWGEPTCSPPTCSPPTYSPPQ